MGLDIYVGKLCKIDFNEFDSDNCIKLTDDYGNYCDKDIPEFAIKLKTKVTETTYDWEKFKEITDINVLKLISNNDYFTIDDRFLHLINETGNEIVVDLKNVPSYNNELYVIGYVEVGYQRNILNEKFYRDYRSGKIGEYVWTKKELERYKDEYCDEPYEYIYPNGEHSGRIIYPKNDFQKCIIDNFIDGECVAIFC